MTEEEWLACNDLQRLIKIEKGAKFKWQRKLRLFACACARRIWEHLPEQARLSIEVSERFAETAANKAELEEMYEAFQREWGTSGYSWISVITTGMAVLSPDASFAALYTSSHCPFVAIPPGTKGRKKALNLHRQSDLFLFRDIFRIRFRPVTLHSSWLTSTVVALANGIYSEKAFYRMPILADALQDAGARMKTC